MRVAFLSEEPEGSVSGHSGTSYYLSQAIRAGSEYFEYFQTFLPDLDALRRGITGSLDQLKADGARLSQQLERAEVDVVVCFGSSMIPWLETDKTVVLWHDATCFSLSRLGFDEFQAHYPFLRKLDAVVLARCDLVVFAAEWLRGQTLRCYDVPPEKVHVVPFGANMQPLPDWDLGEAIAARGGTPCRLTFLGVDWLRKGLPLVYDVLRRLREGGLEAELTIVGCEIRGITRKHRLRHLLNLQPLTDIERFGSRVARDPSVHQAGFLKKDDPLHYDELSRILQRTHFLLHPAEYEPFGIALAEANAFGVPVLATAGYGPRTIIREGRNGHVYEPAEYVERATQFIRQQMSDLAGYQTLATSSYAEYRDRLNWAIGWQRVKALVAQQALASSRKQ